MTGPEASREQSVRRWCKTVDIDCVKFGSIFDTKWPDRIYLFNYGLAVFIEWKAPGKKPDTGQQRKIDRLRSRGFKVEVFDNVQEAKKWLSGFLIPTS
jgi:hypothetical protein